MSRVDFDSFLETAGPEGPSRAKQLSLSSETLAHLQSACANLIRIGTCRDEILAALGTPDHADGTRACYALPSKPGYRFAFVFDVRSCLIGSGYVVVTKRSSPGALSAECLNVLRVMGATADEVLEWYGQPDDVVGWWPVETWTYGAHHFDLRLGIVV